MSSIDARPECRELVEWWSGVDAIRADALEIFSGRDNDAFNRHPGPGRWSVAEVFDHLLTTWHRYKPCIERTITDGRARNITGAAPFEHRGMIANWLIGQLAPPPRRRFPAPKAFQPSSSAYDLSKVQSRFMAALDERQATMREADGLDLARLKFTSPLTRFVRMTLGQGYRLLDTHDRRHLWQARAVVNEVGNAYVSTDGTES
jgi:hypothetical protein